MRSDHIEYRENTMREWSIIYLAPSGGLGSCLGLRTGVSPHFSTNSKREMLADLTRGEPRLPPRAPCWTSGATHTHGRGHAQTAPGDEAVGVRRYRSRYFVTLLPTLTYRPYNIFPARRRARPSACLRRDRAASDVYSEIPRLVRVQWTRTVSGRIVSTTNILL